MYCVDQLGDDRIPVLTMKAADGMPVCLSLRAWAPPLRRRRRTKGIFKVTNDPHLGPTPSGALAVFEPCLAGAVAWRWGAHPVHGVGARGRRSERTQGPEPVAQHDPAPLFF